jgi:exoribonuclease R
MSPTKKKGAGSDKNRVTGIISINSRAVGYLASPGETQDIEIHEENLNTALPGDEVEVAILPKTISPVRRRGERAKAERRSGEVVRIISRAHTEFVGAIEKDAHGCFVVPDNRKVYTAFLIPAQEAAALETGLKVVVRLSEWNDPKKKSDGYHRLGIGQGRRTCCRNGSDYP